MNFFSRRGQRGQIYSTDAMLSLVIFSFCLVVIVGLSNQLIAQSNGASTAQTTSMATERILFTLLSTPGVPAYWNALTDKNTVTLIGFVTQGSEISARKWSAFLDWNASDYPSLKTAMGIEGKEFYMTIVDSNRNTLSQAGTAPTDSNQVSFVSLPFVYRNAPVTVNLQVYTR